MKDEALCEFERDVLRSMAGLGPSIPWGAAFGAALEFLKGRGYVAQIGGVWSVTERGRSIVDPEAQPL